MDLLTRVYSAANLSMGEVLDAHLAQAAPVALGEVAAVVLIAVQAVVAATKTGGAFYATQSAGRGITTLHVASADRL